MSISDTGTAPVDAAAVAPTVPVPAFAPAAELRIEAEPAELRVWSNTRVRLAIGGPGAAGYERFVWHFEDGSDPVAGAVVEHTFAESVRDRHVTVEAQNAGAAAVVVSLRLPVERLEVVPVDGSDATTGRLPASPGLRLVLVGGPLAAAQAAELAAAVGPMKADVLVLAGTRADAEALAFAIAPRLPAAAILHLPLETQAVLPGAVQTEPALAVIHDPGERLGPVRRGDRDVGVWSLGDLAITVVDTRGETVAEPELKRLREALQLAGAYRTSLLFSARPLALFRDGELIADRAYRIYEHALRQQTAAVVSAASGVFYDGRFGGLRLVAIGSAAGPGQGPTGCPRLQGDDACQPPSLTVLDVGERGQLSVHVVTGRSFGELVPRGSLPSEVGKVRR